MSSCYCSETKPHECELCMLNSLERGIQDALSVIRKDPWEAAVKLQGFMYFDDLRQFVRNSYTLARGHE